MLLFNPQMISRLNPNSLIFFLRIRNCDNQIYNLQTFFSEQSHSRNLLPEKESKVLLRLFYPFMQPREKIIRLQLFVIRWLVKSRRSWRLVIYSHHLPFLFQRPDMSFFVLLDTCVFTTMRKMPWLDRYDKRFDHL